MLVFLFNLNLRPSIGSQFIRSLIKIPNQTITFLGFKNPLITIFFFFMKMGMHNSFLTYKTRSWINTHLMH